MTDLEKVTAQRDLLLESAIVMLDRIKNNANEFELLFSMANLEQSIKIVEKDMKNG